MEFEGNFLELILSNLEEEDLEKCLEIKHFRDVIFKSRKLMSKLTLKLTRDSWKKIFGYWGKIRRKYHQCGIWI